MPSSKVPLKKRTISIILYIKPQSKIPNGTTNHGLCLWENSHTSQITNLTKEKKIKAQTQSVWTYRVEGSTVTPWGGSGMWGWVTILKSAHSGHQIDRFSGDMPYEDYQTHWKDIWENSVSIPEFLKIGRRPETTGLERCERHLWKIKLTNPWQVLVG